MTIGHSLRMWKGRLQTWHELSWTEFGLACCLEEPGSRDPFTGATGNLEVDG